MTDIANPGVKQDDPDHIQEGRDVIIDTSAKTIELLPYHATTNTEGRINERWGVTGQCVASFLALRWKNNEALRSFDFPVDGVDRGKNYILLFGWNWKDDPSRKLLRDVGWAVQSDLGVNPTEQWANVTTLGALQDNDADYVTIEQNPDKAVNDSIQANHPGPANESFRVWLDTNADGTPDEDFTSHLVVKSRSFGDTFAEYNVLVENGITSLTYDVYPAAISTTVDTNLTSGLVDTDIDPNGDGNPSDGIAPYNGMSIGYYVVNQQRDTGDGAADYNTIIDANSTTNATHIQTWDFAQWALRQTTNINANTGGAEPSELNTDVIGLKADGLLEWRADGKLHTKAGVFIDNLAAASQNSVVFHDVNDVTHEYPLSVPVIINSSQLLVDDPRNWFHLWYETGEGAQAGNDYGTATAITVQDTGNTDIKGPVTGLQMSFSFDYTNDNDRGNSNADFSVVLVSRGASTDGAGWVKSIKTVTTNGVSFDLNPPTDRAFNNPPG